MRADTPFKAIACFDAVMRTGSATLAAERLFVTPGAVTQQLRKLEEWLGVRLFERSVRKLHPTGDGLRYWSQVRPALEQIAQANADLHANGEQHVSLSLPPAFANTWFARRMGDLTRRLPALKLHLNADADTVDFDTGSFDLAVRHFSGRDDRLHAHRLLVDEVRVYCSPDYQREVGLVQLEDIQRATLLHTTFHANWSRWLASAGVSSSVLPSGIRFDQSELAITAAKSSQGLVLTSPWLVEDDVERGRLIQLFPHSLRTGKGYYLVYGKGTVLGPGAQDLYDWMMSCVPTSDWDVSDE